MLDTLHPSCVLIFSCYFSSNKAQLSTYCKYQLNDEVFQVLITVEFVCCVRTDGEDGPGDESGREGVREGGREGGSEGGRVKERKEEGKERSPLLL